MNWSRSRYTDAICLVIVTLTLLGTVAFINGESWGLTRVSSDGAADRDGTFSARDWDATWDAASATMIDLSNLATLSSSGAYALDDDVYIVNKGTYVLSGELTDHQIIVEAKGAKVQLVLAGVTLRHETLSPLVVTKADKVFLTLAADSQNVIAAGDLSSAAAVAADTDAAVYASSDLAINGDGALTVMASGGHGLKSTDDLVITGGQLTVQADNTAILGKDSVRIAGGTFDLQAREGIKANRENKEAKGYVVITGGTFDLTVEGDGIQAETTLTISDGTFKIVTGGGAASAPAHAAEGFPGGGIGGPRGGINGLAENGELGAGGTPPAPPTDMNFDINSGNMGMPPDFAEFEQFLSSSGQPRTGLGGETGEVKNPNSTDSEISVSRKGLKAGTSLTVSGGNLELDCYDDAVHTDGELTIRGGQLTIATGDDGLHADGEVHLDGGTVVITSSYEGIEGAKIYVEGGVWDVTSSDDGFNASDGSGETMPGGWGRPGEASGMAVVASEDLPLLQIDGGTVRVHAGGDGLDSNGDLIINGGDIIIDGPSDSGNGALDSGAESGGELSVHGGVVLALGASGMAETFSTNSTQASLAVTFESNYTAGQQLAISDQTGQELFSYEVKKSGNSVVFSSPDLAVGQTYTVSVGAQSQTITQDSISAGASSGGMGGRPGGMGGPDGGMMGQGGSRGGRGPRPSW